jgi:hypothetical protein
VDLQERRAMGGIGSVEALHEAEAIDDLGDVGEELADPRPALAMLLEPPRTPEQVAGLGELDAGLLSGEGLAVVALQARLVVEGVDLRRAAVHEQEDHPLGPRGEVGGPLGEGPGRVGIEQRWPKSVRRRPGQGEALRKHRREGDAAEADAAASKHLATRLRAILLPAPGAFAAAFSSSVHSVGLSRW